MTNVEDARRAITNALDTATYRIGHPIVDVSLTGESNSIVVDLEDGSTWKLTIEEV